MKLGQKFSQKLRQIWHDTYYKNASQERIHFALKCQDVTASIDLHEKPTGLSGQFRFWLHLSICQACKNYYSFSKVLSTTIKKNPPKASSKIEQLNRALVEKYSQSKNK